MKKFLIMWQIWAAVAIMLVILMFAKTDSIANLLPFALLLICPIMMLIMMKDHKH